MNHSALRLLGSLVLVCLGCVSSVPTADDEARELLETDTVSSQLHNGYGVIALRFQGLEPLGAGFVYEGWVIVDGKPYTAGRFELTSRNANQTLVFVDAKEILENATAYVLTIEPKDDDEPTPSKVHVLAADLPAPSHVRIAQLSLGHMAAIGDSFANATGSFLLATPSTSQTDDNQFGIWFLKPPDEGGAPAPSLVLPLLPEGWQYEGWVVTAQGPVSTGRFSQVAGEDSDGAGATAGPNAGPPFPGQDFINPPIDLRGTKVVISVEPQPDDSAAPFAIKPLAAGIALDAPVAVPTPMSNIRADRAVNGLVGIFVP